MAEKLSPDLHILVTETDPPDRPCLAKHLQPGGL